MSYKKIDGYTSDVVLFTYDESQIKVLLIKRGEEPYKDKYALSGGFINYGESSKSVALHKLEEETSLKGIYLKELGMYDSANRDERGWIISNAFYSVVSRELLEGVSAGERTLDVALVPYEELLDLELAFDHKQIIKDAYEQLLKDLRETTVAKEFLPKEFTASQLHTILFTFGATTVSLANFMTKLKKFNFIQEVTDEQGNTKTIKINDGVTKRPSKLYSYVEENPKATIY